MNHQQNHTENHHDFSQRKSEIFIEKINILMAEIKISMSKIEIFIEDSENIQRLPNRCQWVSKAQCKKPAKFQTAVAICKFLCPGMTLYLDDRF